MCRTLLVLFVALTVLVVRAEGDEEEGRLVAEIKDRIVSFDKDIQPILRRNCLACHNESETEGELILETPETLMDGGDSGPAVEPGDANESLIFQLAAHRSEPVMPPVDNDVGAKPLSPEQLGLLKLWIQQGAKADESTTKEEIKWRPVPDSYAPIFAMELSSSGYWLVAGRGNQLVVYSVAGKRELQRLVDPSIQESHPECAHLDIVQAVAVSPDQQTVVSGGYRNIKVWRRVPTSLAKTEVVSEALATYLKTADAAKLDVVDQEVTPDGKHLIALEKTDDGVKPRLYSLPDRKLIQEFEATVFDRESIEGLTRKVGLRKERLRVAKADVDVAKKRKEDDEKNAKKSAEELKKSEEELPKKHEALAKAKEVAKKADEEFKTGEQAVAEHKKRIEELKQELAAAKDDAKQKLTESQKKATSELKQQENKQKNLKTALDKAKAEEKKKQQEFEGAEKVVQLGKEAKARAEKAVELRATELTDAEQEAASFEELQKEAEATLATAKKTAAETPHEFTRVELIDDGWQFALFDAAGNVARFVTSTGQLVGIDHDCDGDTIAGEWALVKTIGYPDDDSIFADRVTSLAFSHDGMILAVGGGEPSRSGEVQLWNTADWTRKATIEDVHSDVVYDLQFSPQDNLLASCASDRMMKLIDPETAQPLRSFEGHTGHVLGVSWRADGRILATAGADKVVKVWDAKEGTQKKTVSGFKTEVTAVRFMGLEDRLVFTVGDGQVQSRDSNGGGKPAFAGFTDYVHKVSSSQDGKVVAAAGQDRVIRVWDDKGKLIVDFK